jgi:hypothetical protein
MIRDRKMRSELGSRLTHLAAPWCRAETGARELREVIRQVRPTSTAVGVETGTSAPVLSTSQSCNHRRDCRETALES